MGKGGKGHCHYFLEDETPGAERMAPAGGRAGFGGKGDDGYMVGSRAQGKNAMREMDSCLDKCLFPI